MAKRKRNAAVRRYRKAPVARRRRRRNPGTMPALPAVARRRSRGRGRPFRRNPSIAGGGRRIQSLLEDSVYAIGGGTATRGLTQLVLGPKNNGLLGYAANAGLALALGMLGGKAFGRRAGDMMALGGFVGLVMRIITEQTAIGLQLGGRLRGLGDYPFAGVRGLRGGFERMDFFTPLASADPTGMTPASKPPAMLTDSIAAALPAPVSNGVSGLSAGRSRYGGGRVWGR